jgi:hypothetical protein
MAEAQNHASLNLVRNTMTDKVDKGFCLNYWRLSYRRKMLRTLWMIPPTFLFFFFPVDMTFWGLKRNLFIGCLFVLWGVQALYAYIMWRKKETPM